MIAIFVRGDTVRVLRKITSVEERCFADKHYALFQPRAMFTTDYLSTYDAIAVLGFGVTDSRGDLAIHWIKEPKHD